MHFVGNFNTSRVIIGGKSPLAGTSLTGWKNLTTTDNLLNMGALATGTVSVSSSSATDNASTGAREVLVFGLDAAFKPQVESFVLNGLTARVGLKTFSRVFAMEVSLSGTGKINAGDIYCYTTGTALTSGVPTALTTTWVKALAGEGSGSNGFYTVPAGYTAIIEKVILSCRGQVADMGLWAESPVSNTLENLFQLSLLATGPVMETGSVNYTFKEKTDLYLRIKPAVTLAIATGLMAIKLIPAKVGQ